MEIEGLGMGASADAMK